MPAYQPPFQLTHRMTVLVADIAERLGTWKAVNRGALVPELRRGYRIRSLQASLAIEQNTLSVEQMTAVLAGKPVLGSPKEVQEVHNAFTAYEAMAHATEAKAGVRVETRVQTRVQTRVEKPARTPDRILSLLRGQPELTLAEVARAMGLAPSTVERAAARLQAEGRLHHVGPKKGGHWEVL